MHSDKRVVAFIPVRGGSKSIPMKNIKPLAGKPLVHWTIEAALGCEAIDTVFVATDSDIIAACVNSLGDSRVQVIGRSQETCTDTASSESALLEFCANADCSHVIFIQATSPLLTSADLSAAWEKYQSNRFDSLLSLVRQKHFIWQEEPDGTAAPINYHPLKRPRRQDFSGYLMENGAFYISERTMILDSGCRISGTIGCYEMPEETYIDLDEPIDWLVTEQLLLARKRTSLSAACRDIQMLVTDVDGVLTDAGMYYAENGDELKKFNTRDGKGLELIRSKGIKTGIITSENTQIVSRRAAKLRFDFVMQGITDKEEALRRMAGKAGIDLSRILYVGDDVNDLPALRIAGLTACPGDAVEAVRQSVDLLLTSRGGEGVVRELCELLLASLAEQGR